MKQLGLDLNLSTKRTRKREFLEEKHNLAVDMLRVVNDLLQYRGLMLRSGTRVDATLISAPISIKNAGGDCDPNMKQAKKGNNWYFGMKVHTVVDIASGLVHMVAMAPANVNAARTGAC